RIDQRTTDVETGLAELQRWKPVAFDKQMLPMRGVAAPAKRRQGCGCVDVRTRFIRDRGQGGEQQACGHDEWRVHKRFGSPANRPQRLARRSKDASRKGRKGRKGFTRTLAR